MLRNVRSIAMAVTLASLANPAYATPSHNAVARHIVIRQMRIPAELSSTVTALR